jgi:hypothetical protein
MSKTVTYFPLQCALNSGPVISAVLRSLEHAGFKIDPNSYDADIAVIWSVLWNGRMAANQDVHRYYRSKGRPVVCIEVGALQRGITWKIALNNITSDGHYGQHSDQDPDRPQKLGIKLQTNTLNHGRVLVAGQHNRSLQLTDVDQEAWYIKQIQDIDKQIVIRPHPRCTLDRSRFPTHVVWEQPKRLADTYDSFDMHWDFDTVINYNSGPGIQAAIAGVPVVVDRTSLAYNIRDREQWLIDICHTEYTLEEIERGTWVRRIGLEP